MKNLKAKSLAKLLVLLLSVALICAGVVIAVGAEDANVAEVTIGDATTQYTNFDDALAATSGKEATVKLLSDVTMTKEYIYNSNITIDLNGYTLTSAAPSATKLSAFGHYDDLVGMTLSFVGNGKIVHTSEAIRFIHINNNTLNIKGTTGTIEVVATGAKGRVFNLDAPLEGTNHTFENVKFNMQYDGIAVQAGKTARVDMQNVEIETVGVGTNPLVCDGATMNLTGVRIESNILKNLFYFGQQTSVVNLNYCYFNLKSTAAKLFSCVGTEGSETYPASVTVTNSILNVGSGNLNIPTRTNYTVDEKTQINPYQVLYSKDIFDESAIQTTSWNLNNAGDLTAQGGAYVVLTDEGGNNYTQYKPNGTFVTNSDGSVKAPELHLNNGIRNDANYINSTGNIIVYSVDIKASEAGKFTKAQFYVTARNGGGLNLRIFDIAANGSVWTRGSEYDTQTVQLSVTEWNNITTVVDSNYTDGYRAYTFVNGQYIGTIYQTVDIAKFDSTYIYGLGCTIQNDAAGVLSTDTDLLFDNAIARVYPPITDAEDIKLNIDKDLAGLYGNEALNSLADVNLTSSYNITVSEIPTPDIDEAITVASELGLTAELTGNVTTPQKVTVNGKLLVNGHDIVFADDSNPYNVVTDSSGNTYYEFIETVRVTHGETVKKFTTFDAALTYAKGKGTSTITLLENAAMTVRCDPNANDVWNINLNGKVLNITTNSAATYTGRTFVITNSNSVVFTGTGTINADCTNFVEANSAGDKFAIVGVDGTIELNFTNETISSTPLYINAKENILENVKITAKSTGVTPIAASNLEMKNVEIEAAAATGSIIKAQNSTNVNISDVKIKSTNAESTANVIALTTITQATLNNIDMSEAAAGQKGMYIGAVNLTLTGDIISNAGTQQSIQTYSTTALTFKDCHLQLMNPDASSGTFALQLAGSGNVLFEDSTITTKATNQKWILPQSGTTVDFNNVVFTSDIVGQPLFYIGDNININMTNVDLTANKTNTVIFQFNGITGKLNLTGVKFNTQEATSGMGFFHSNGTTIETDVTMKYCSFDVKNMSILSNQSAEKHFKSITIENSQFLPTGTGKFSNSNDTFGTVVNISDSYIGTGNKVITDTTVFPAVWNAQPANDVTQGGAVTTVTDPSTGNVYTMYKPDGTIFEKSDGSKPNPELMTAYGVSANDQIKKITGNIVVHSVDIKASETGKFTACTNIGVTARDSSKRNLSLIKLNNNGLVQLSGASGGDTNSVQLSATEWNKITVVVDTNYTDKFKAFIFVNGQYMGSAEGAADDTTNIFGIFFYIAKDASGVLGTDTDLLLDNSITKTYHKGVNSDGTLVNIDKSLASFYALGAEESAFNITVAGVPTPDLEKAFTDAGALRLDFEIKGNVNDPQTVKTDAVIPTNGYSIAIANDSYIAIVEKDENGNPVSYDFKAEYSTYYVTYKFNIGGGVYKEVNVLVNTVPSLSVNDLTEEEKATYNALSYDYLKDGKYYQANVVSGWSLSEGPFGTEVISAPVTLEEALAFNQGKLEAITVYPIISTANGNIKLYDAIAVDGETGEFIRGINTLGNGATWWGTQRAAVALKYGETLKFQCNISIQDSLYNGSSFIGGEPHATLGKTYGIDLNGYTLTFDRNAGQVVMNDNIGNAWLQVKPGETLNVYSSVPGGKIVTYSVNTTDLGADKLLEDGGTLVTPEGYKYGYNLIQNVTQEEYNEYLAKKGSSYIKTDAGYLTMHTIVVGGWTKTGTNADGVPIGKFELTERYEQILGVGSNHLFDMLNADNSHLNIGKYGSIPGSNLTLEVCALVRANGGNASSVNVDGATIIRNSDGGSSYPAVFYLYLYNGAVNVNNATIVSPVDNDIIYGNPYQGEGEIGIIAISNSIIIVKNDGEAIIAGKFTNPIYFMGVTTNGAINKTDSANIILGQDNKYFITDATMADNTVNAIIDSQMEVLGSITYEFKYVTLNPNATYSNTKDFDYLAVTETKTLPILGYTSTTADNTVSLEYEDLNGNIILTETYVKGTATRNTKVSIPTENFKYIIVKVDGFNTPEVMYEDATATPKYEATVNTTGVMLNVAVYADFGLNIYVPKELNNNVSVLIDGQTVTPSSSSINGESYNKYRAMRKSYESEKDVEVTFTATEGGFTATKVSSIDVVSYASMVLGLYDDSTIDAKLMYYMLNYAKASNTYFNKTESGEIANLLKNADISDYDSSNMVPTFSGAELDAISAAGLNMAIDVDSENLAYIFTITNEKYDKSLVKVTLNDTAYTADAEGVIEIKGLKVYNFAKDFVINIDGLDIHYNLGKFAYTYNNPYTEDMSEEQIAAIQKAAPLVEAFYKYAMCATEYKTSQAVKYVDKRSEKAVEFILNYYRNGHQTSAYGGPATAVLAMPNSFGVTADDIRLANEAIIEVSNYLTNNAQSDTAGGQGEVDFVAIRLVRLLFLEDNNKSRITEETQEALDRFFLQDNFESSHKSENHMLMSRAARYLAACYYAEQNATFTQYNTDGEAITAESTNKTPITAAALKALDEEYLISYMKHRAKYGWAEFNSLDYEAHNFNSLLALYECSGNAEVSKLAEMLMETMLVTMIENTTENGISGGAHGRGYSYAVSGLEVGMYHINALYFGLGDFENTNIVASIAAEPYIALSSWRPDESIYSVYANKTYPFVSYEKVQNHTLAYEPQDFGAINKYTYNTPLYSIGAINRQDSFPADNSLSWYEEHQQTNWSLAFANNATAGITVHHPGETSLHQYWCGDQNCKCNHLFGNKNIVMGIFYIPGETMLVNSDGQITAYNYIHASIDKASFDKIVEDPDNNRLFVKLGDAYAALTFSHSYAWGGKDANNEIVIYDGDKTKDIRIAFACQAGDKDSDGSFESFIANVSDKTFAFNSENLSLEYGNMSYDLELNGTTVIAENQFIDGEAVDSNYTYTYNSPFMKSEWNSGIIEIYYYDKVRVLDFNNNTDNTYTLNEYAAIKAAQ